MALDRILTLGDFESAAKRRLPHAIHTFIASAAEEQRSRDANLEAFDDYAFLPRMLVGIPTRSQSVNLFGRRYASPFGISPMGGAATCAFQGDLNLARAAEAAEIPFVLSGASSVAMETVIENAPSAWYQGYIPSDRPGMGRLLDRVRAAGFKTLVITADVPIGSNRIADRRAGYHFPVRITPALALEGLLHPRWLFGTVFKTMLRTGVPHFENMSADRGGPILGGPSVGPGARRELISWADIAWIRSQWSERLVVKGILRADDAVRAKAAGADGIVVSNHGGRQLDFAQAALRALPSIVDAAGDMTVMLDGGVRRGTDVLKALALGAKFVFVARPMMFASAVAGEAGVRHAIGILQREIDISMLLLGCAEPGAVDRSLVTRAGKV